MARILLVEDDPDQLEFRKLLLENAGHHVQTAVNASDVNAPGPDVEIVVLDLVPGSEQLVAQLPEQTRVVVLSGRDNVSAAVAARSACVLRKPCSSRTLIEALDRLWTSPSK